MGVIMQRYGLGALALAGLLTACGEPAAQGPKLASVVIDAPVAKAGTKSNTPVPTSGADGQTFKPLGQPVLIEPSKATTTEIIEAGKPVQKYWDELTQEQRKEQLALTETVIQVERTSQSGSVTPAFGSIAVSKGTYRVSFLYMQYKNEACGTGATAGYVRTGVGLHVTALIESDQKNLNISGLLPIVAAAEAKKVKGSLVVRTMGITNSSAVLSGYTGKNLNLSTESLIQAMESLAVVRAVIESTDAKLTPNYLAVSGSATGGDCLAKVGPDTKVLGGQTPIAQAHAQ